MNPSCDVMKLMLACGCRPDCEVQVAAPREPRRQLGQHAGMPDPVPAHRVAIAPVPFGPARREVAHLIAALADVPWLRNQLDPGNDRILLDDVEERRQPVHLVQLPGERRREVEAEAVDVHLLHPVAETVHHELQDLRRLHVEGIAAPGEVLVAGAIVGREPVVARVVDAAQRKRGPALVALGRVVVDHVEDDLEAGFMQGAHHHLELAHRVHGGRRGRVPHVGREVGERVVAPVVRQPAIEQVPFVRVVVHRHQLDRRDAQVRQVAQRLVGGQSEVRAAQRARHPRVERREPLDVHLVNDRLVPGPMGRAIAAPVERGVDDGRERRIGRAVGGLGRALVFGAWHVRKQ